MPRPAGEACDALVSVALGKPTRSRLGKYLARATTSSSAVESSVPGQDR